MSRGYYAEAKKIEECEDMAIYAYSGENWNDKNSKEGDALLYDGRLAIGDIDPLNDTYSLDIIKECKNEFIRNETEYFAMKISRKIVQEYIESSEFPELVSFLI